MASVDDIRAALQCGRPNCPCARPRGRLHCPAHDDQHPDLSVDEQEGRVLVFCFAGCKQEAVIEALRGRGLWSGNLPAPRPKGILLDVVHFIRRYVLLPSPYAELAVALWVFHTWTLPAFDVTPYLLIKSPEKRSGKTRLLEVLDLLTPRAWRVIQPSEAVLFRKVSKEIPTLLLDEGDTIFNAKVNGTEPLRAILNAGFRRGAVVPRCVGEGAKQQLINFDTFCPKAVASIGDLPDTVEDRSIIVRLDRATPTEQRTLTRLRFREGETEAVPIREALARWAESAIPKLREARPALPAELDGRAADAWEPLLAVADQAGDGAFVVAWEAALALSTGAARPDDSLRVRLLGDIRGVFDECGIDRIPTTELIDRLCENESAPWGDWHGRRITAQALAKLLRPLGIAPERWREGDDLPRGYAREAFTDAFARYAAPQSEQLEQPLRDAGSGDFQELEQPLLVPDSENGETPRLERAVPSVPIAPPSTGDGGITLADVEAALGPAEVVYDGPAGAYPGRRLRLRRAEGWQVASPSDQVRAAVRAARAVAAEGS